MKKIFITLFVFAFVCSFAFAQEIAPRTRVETMFKSFKPGEIERAIEIFAKDSLVKPELVDSLQSQASTDLPPDNSILGFEFIEEQNMGQSIKRLTYILKTKEEPFVWAVFLLQTGKYLDAAAG